MGHCGKIKKKYSVRFSFMCRLLFILFCSLNSPVLASEYLPTHPPDYPFICLSSHRPILSPYSTLHIPYHLPYTYPTPFHTLPYPLPTHLPTPSIYLSTYPPIDPTATLPSPKLVPCFCLNSGRSRGGNFTNFTLPYTYPNLPYTCPNQPYTCPTLPYPTNLPIYPSTHLSPTLPYNTSYTLYHIPTLSYPTRQIVLYITKSKVQQSNSTKY